MDCKEAARCWSRISTASSIATKCARSKRMSTAVPNVRRRSRVSDACVTPCDRKRRATRRRASLRERIRREACARLRRRTACVACRLVALCRGVLRRVHCRRRGDAVVATDPGAARRDQARARSFREPLARARGDVAGRCRLERSPHRAAVVRRQARRNRRWSRISPIRDFCWSAAASITSGAARVPVLVYRHDKHLIDVFVLPADAPSRRVAAARRLHADLGHARRRDVRRSSRISTRRAGAFRKLLDAAK